MDVFAAFRFDPGTMPLETRIEREPIHHPRPHTPAIIGVEEEKLSELRISVLPRPRRR
jgi:hypothetical protein